MGRVVSGGFRRDRGLTDSWGTGTEEGCVDEGQRPLRARLVKSTSSHRHSPLAAERTFHGGRLAPPRPARVGGALPARASLRVPLPRRRPGARVPGCGWVRVRSCGGLSPAPGTGGWETGASKQSGPSGLGERESQGDWGRPGAQKRQVLFQPKALKQTWVKNRLNFLPEGGRRGSSFWRLILPQTPGGPGRAPHQLCLQVPEPVTPAYVLY